MRNIDYNKQLYLYDDRSKYDYMFKVVEIIFQDEDNILCRVETIGGPEDTGHKLEEKILIDKQSGEVKNSDYYSWYATSDQEWVDETIVRFIKRSQQY